MTTITIHRGELRHIRKIITDSEDKNKRKLEGTLHGLWTESGQPVIQLVCARPKRKKTLEILQNEHGLLELGEWIVAAPSKKKGKGNLSLVFDLEGEPCQAYDTKGNPATLEMLKGQSAFRLYEPLTNALCELTGVNNSPINDKKEQDKPFADQPKHVHSNDTEPITSYTAIGSSYTSSNTDNTPTITHTIAASYTVSSNTVDTPCYNDFKSHVNKSSYNDKAASHTVSSNTVDTPCYNDFKPHVNKSSYSDEAASHTVDMSSYDDVRTQSTKIQWYNSNRDTVAKTVDFVHSKLSDDNNLQISRKVETENMTIQFTHHNQYWIIEFPPEFPLGVVDLKRINSSESTDTSTRMWVEKISTHSPDVQCMYNALWKTLTTMCSKCTHHKITYL